MLDALVRAISMLDYTVAVAKLSPHSLIIKSSTTMDILGHLSVEGSFPPSVNFSRLERV